MDLNEYQTAAMRTATSNERANTPEQRLINAVLGFAGETGEFADTLTTGNTAIDTVLSLIANVGSLADGLKKHLFHGHAFDTDDVTIALDILQGEIYKAREVLAYADSISQAKDAARLSSDEKAHLVKETGDLLWYAGLAATALDTSLEEVALRNVEKLKKRYPNGFSAEASRNREA